MATESQQKNTISGKVVSVESRTGVNRNNMDYIGGTVSIETAQDNIIPVSFYANLKKNDGGMNGLYQSLQTVVSDYKTIATHGREDADVVEVGVPKLAENSFFVRDGQMIRGFQFSSPFFNRKADAGAKGEFNITGEIVRIVEDIKDEIPTGNLTITMLVVGYKNAANLVDFKVEGEKAVNYAKTNFSPGMEVKLTGDIINEEHIDKKTTEAAFGDPIVEEIRRVERKLLVRSATPPVDSPISEEERTTMLAERESRLQQAKEDFMKKNKTNTNTNAKGKGESAANFSL